MAPALSGGAAGRAGRAGAGTGHWELGLASGGGHYDSGSWKQETRSRHWVGGAGTGIWHYYSGSWYWHTGSWD